MSAPLERALVTLNPLVPVSTQDWLALELSSDEREWLEENERTSEDNTTTFWRYAHIHETVGYVRSKKVREVRELLQRLGTEVGRDIIDPDCWVQVAARLIDRETLFGRSVVITGIRYVNELRMIRQHGGLAAWIDRPGYGPANAHSSDNSLTAEDFDVVIRNDSTLEHLATVARHQGQIVQHALGADLL